ncbi:MAG: hypothetical protein QOJ98_1760 [Acidobacteriota bacterium]|jgi:hypothetical protein|nr:hypothetical protein [Acidobacteriota bacterium]
MWRKALALAIAVAAVLAVHQLVVVPWRCSIVEGAVSKSTPEERSDDPFIRRRAEENVARLASCARRCRTNVNLAVLAGENLMVLGRREAAIPLYEQALRYSQRPEIYMALAVAQAESGDREAALQNSIRAADFAGNAVLLDMPDGAIRYQAHEIVGARHERTLARSGRVLAKAIIDSYFIAAVPAGTPMAFAGIGEAPSAAEDWTILNAAGETTTRVELSARRQRVHDIHVAATRAGGGIKYKWPAAQYASRVESVVWVYVKRGRISIGSGNGRPPMANAYSKKTGQWERLEAVNESCPAKMIVIQAASDDGAEFIVDSVRVRPTAGAPPCE